MNKEEENPGNGFSGIVGQEIPMRVLGHLLKADRLPGTLLFCGPGSVGKYAAAVSLAKYLACKGGRLPGCECRSCTAIRTGSHPDVIVLSREKSIGVEEMRELITLAALRSSKDHERTIIIDRAEVITDQAANAALKTLEEPGDHVRFILVTDTPEALLTTVRSRSYRLRFSLVKPFHMAEFADAIGDDAAESDSREAIRFAGGRPGAYLRYRHSENYRDVVSETSAWVNIILQGSTAPRIKDGLKWKDRFWELAGKLTDAEQSLNIPRGGDINDLRKNLKNPQKYPVGPANWRTEQTTASEKRWTQSRRAVLLTGLIRRILYLELNDRSVHAINALHDFMEKLKYNCNMDIALERLYYGLAGFKG